MAAHLTIVAQKVVLFSETMDEAPDECSKRKRKSKRDFVVCA